MSRKIFTYCNSSCDLSSTTDSKIVTQVSRDLTTNVKTISRPISYVPYTKS